MLTCADCGSNNIIEKTVYHAYFREGEWVRLRGILVWENKNDSPLHGYLASCPELSKTAVAIGDTELLAITKLGDMLHKMHPSIELRGSKLDAE